MVKSRRRRHHHHVSSFSWIAVVAALICCCWKLERSSANSWRRAAAVSSLPKSSVFAFGGAAAVAQRESSRRIASGSNQFRGIASGSQEMDLQEEDTFEDSNLHYSSRDAAPLQVDDQEARKWLRNLQDDTCACDDVPTLPLHAQPATQQSYTIGVLEFRGVGTALALHNVTFGDYLTETAGKRFDPPIRFRMTEVNFQTMFDAAESKDVDFVYVSPSPFACVEAEYGAQSLISHISKRVIGNDTYELSKFGGVILARADNEDIQGIVDLKDKIVASAAISSFGGGQMQFREVEKVGLSYINDPKQVIFTGDQAVIVQGVLSGKFDAGFVRTDQTERTIDEVTGEPVDKALLKVLDAKDNYLEGKPFPFAASTPLYPEWNLAALSHVPADVSREVQSAMLALSEHAKIGEAMVECLGRAAVAVCNDLDQLVPAAERRYDTTVKVAQLALAAMTNGKYAGFRVTRSYFEIHAMLQDTNFIKKDPESNIWRCARPAELYAAIICPPGHFKRSKEQVEQGCAVANLTCDEGYQCLCHPCIKAYDVDISPQQITGDGPVAGETSVQGAGCAKMSMCGVTEQKKPLLFRAVDNKVRQLAIMNVTVLQGSRRYSVPVKQFPYSNIYEFAVESDEVGVLIVEVSIDGEQIPESPILVQVVQRDCEARYPGQQRVANDVGQCICAAGTVEIGSVCIPLAALIPAILIPICLIVVVAAFLYLEKKKREADAVWSVDPDDLIFPTPLQIIGQGTFGLVLLAEYRGTQVAVKRVLPARDKVTGMASTAAAKRKLLKTGSDRILTTMSAAFSKKLLMNHCPDETAPSYEMKYSRRDNDVEQASASMNEEESVSHHSFSHHSDRHSGRSLGMMSSNGFQSTPTLDGSNRGMTTHGMGTSGGGASTVVHKSQYKRAKADFINEMRLLSKLRHPCITTVMGAVIQKGEDPMLIMEYMNHGSLYDLLHNETMILDGEFLLHMLRDISSGVRFLHSAKPQVIHGDLKSANVLVDNKFRAKVADFGLTQKKHYGNGLTGTPYFMAPELLRGDTPHTAASDMYAIGIILYELYSRKEPYEGEWPEEVLQLVCDQNINKRPPVPQSCPPDVAKMMKQLVSGDPAQRPTSSDFDNRLKDLTVSSVEPGEMRSSHQMKKNGPANTNRNNREFLEQIFPTHIADVLVSGGKVEPESHELVTIFFSDIVGFTNIASTIEPIKISNLLDRLYLSFDGLARKYDVFKIETIGDAYMCSSNLAKDQTDDHVKRIAEFAMEAVIAASKVLIDEDDVGKGYVQIRAGFHTGPVVSNVVGSLNPRYGVFGDTVNVSARMESTSEKGRIQCSERSAHLLTVEAPQIPIRLRGETKIKGKGKMTTYWVGESDAESHDLVTVYCAVLVTTLNDRFDDGMILAPHKKSSLVERLQLQLDNLAQKHEVFRIEASGDGCYMWASNIVRDQSYDHVKRIAEFAIEATRAANELLLDQEHPQLGHASIRSGFHSGSATASMSGFLRPKYDVTGDSVKLARRLSSASEAGRILCSSQSAALLSAQAPNIELKVGIEMAKKGRRKVSTYWVNEGKTW